MRELQTNSDGAGADAPTSDDSVTLQGGGHLGGSGLVGKRGRLGRLGLDGRTIWDKPLVIEVKGVVTIVEGAEKA